ncbi:MAG: LysM peptidoglycan-binding domain-containing protein [Candidatus Adiutrix sp.]|nr:LysM peptidoglycan-binding domain-containing protein [Candidatus Adiutrix sp.]
MKHLNKKHILTIAAQGLAPALLWIFCSSSGHLLAAAAAEDAAGHTITLTKVLEVYEFEDLKVSVDQYQVKRGDSLGKLLKSRGFSISRQDEAKMIRLVKSLNPELKNPSALEPGQMINLPSKLDEKAAEKIQEPQETQSAETSSPPMATETLKVYDRPQTTQQSARVVVLRHTGAQEASPPAEVSPATPLAQPAQPQPAPASKGEPGQAQPAPAAPAYPGLDFPSGNAGPLAQEPQSQVIYRTVTVRRGDSLERLLRREGMHVDLIYHHLLKVTQQLNPEIKNTDLIIAGAEIKIPAAGDYLTALAGVNPQEIKGAALAIAERRRPAAVRSERPSRRAAVMELPAEAVVSAKNTLGLLLTRLGEKVNSQGQMLIPAGSGAVELNTSDFPVLELSGGSRVVLDPGSRLPQTTVRDLARLSPPYLVFRTSKKETLEQALGRLWSLCGYYRVYTKDRAYEGGGDIRLKINADWMVWPTQEAWNAGQPLVINKARSPEQPTSPAWVSFLQDHGIKVVDIYRNALVPAGEAPTAPAELPVVNLAETSSSPAHLAAGLAKALGLEPRLSAQVALARQPGATVAPTLTAPLLWEKNKNKVVMEFGELPAEAVQTLHQSGYTVVSCQRDDESVIDGVLAGLAVKPGDSLTLAAPAGGPKMSLTIKGRLATMGPRKFFITRAAMPSGLARLAEPGLTVIKY